MESCFVHIQLPHTEHAVVCGRFVHDRLSSGDAIGRFVYGRSYRARADAIAIDPVHLPLSAETFETIKLEGMFGALRDSSPDAWGRRVIEHALGRTDVSEIDYLLNSPEDRVGALSFGLTPEPPPPIRDFNRTEQLHDLFAAARELEKLAPGQVASPRLRRLQKLVEAGTSMGGARPKSVVVDKKGFWLAKFPAHGDRWNNSAVEAAMLALAKRCGIRIPDFRIEKIGSASVLLIKRFDREIIPGNARTCFRSRMVSALTVLDAAESGDRRNWSYLALSDELQRWSSRPADDRIELFRRMVFNALVTNNDDHPRNHALVAPATDWRLSPVYDITPNPMRSHERDLAMVCGLFAGRRATRANLISSSARFGLTREDADTIILKMRSVVTKRWEMDVRAHGGTDADCNSIRAAFEIPGFDVEA